MLLKAVFLSVGALIQWLMDQLHMIKSSSDIEVLAESVSIVEG